MPARAGGVRSRSNTQRCLTSRHLPSLPQWPAVQRRGELAARNISNTLWALAKLSHHPGDEFLQASVSCGCSGDEWVRHHVGCELLQASDDCGGMVVSAKVGSRG